MQQQPPQVMTMMPSFPPTNITTEQIQKYLDENKKLILAILDNQNLGKLAECAQYQAVLQKNLMYLAAIADAQPPAAQASPQMPTHPAMQQGAHFMQHPQAAAIAQQQAGTFAQNTAMHFNPHQQEHHQQQQHQQLHQQHQQAAMHSHMVMRPGGPNNGMHMMHGEASLGGGGNSGAPPSSTGPSEFSRGTGPGASSSSLDARGGSKPEVEAGSNDGQGNSPAPGNADDN